MSTDAGPVDERVPAQTAKDIFEREIGASGVEAEELLVGNETFLKFRVGRPAAPLYTYALHAVQASLESTNPFRGLLGLLATEGESFTSSLESRALLTLLTRSTREVSEDPTRSGFSVPYVPFHNREDHQLAQPATHVVYGRRGVGKSTLIRRAVSLLADTADIVVVLDMQTYVALAGDDLVREVLHDVARSIRESALRVAARKNLTLDVTGLDRLANDILGGSVPLAQASPALKRVIQSLSRTTGGMVVVFLDDYHLVDNDSQPALLSSLHGALKGANGWLKVAGLKSLLNHYSGSTRLGLQIPGDAQPLSLDLTLENPEAAEGHLRAILESFLGAVGYSFGPSVIQKDAFRRLVWANAGVPRDFLQMFARALELAQRNKHPAVTKSDVNIAIGEFGQRKSDDLEEDARNSAGGLQKALQALGRYCLEEKKTNAFLVSAGESRERELVHVLSDLRMAHLIHQSVTGKKAGERFEAYILDYSTFTGFRRRQGIKEMIPKQLQFKASDLKKLPKITAAVLAESPTQER
jgi:Cdc6-like AAA superfamily ATPase